MKIYIVGIGPGAQENMTFEAFETIKKCEVIVGYNKYIEIIDAIIDHDRQTVIATPMMGEVDRCKQAVEQALLGKTVAVVSSGDAGIYGMAGLVFELAKEHTELEIHIVAGVTAAVSAASVLGAPLMNDFCVISLSDLMTPWEIIEKRLNGAAIGDFAVALYNPSSVKRSDYLFKACAILLEHKSGQTPCGFVRNIGREGTTYELCTLSELQNKKVDMFTTVIVGNSQTNIINGRLVTARGYSYE